MKKQDNFETINKQLIVELEQIDKENVKLLYKDNQDTIQNQEIIEKKEKTKE